MRVDLPAPFSPTRPRISPSATWRSTERRAWTPGKDLSIPCISRTRRRSSAGADAVSAIVMDVVPRRAPIRGRGSRHARGWRRSGSSEAGTQELVDVGAVDGHGAEHPLGLERLPAEDLLCRLAGLGTRVAVGEGDDHAAVLDGLEGLVL